MGKILLTGVTGLVGSAFVVALLREKPTERFVCLVRSNGGGTAEERAAKLMDIQKNIMKRSQRKKIGSVMKVIIDQISEGIAYARGAADAPDIDNVVMFNAPRSTKVGAFADVKIIKTAGSDLIAEKCRR